jgi:hypothetical protein
MKKKINNIEYYIDNKINNEQERLDIIDKLSEISIEEIIEKNILLKHYIEKEDYNKCKAVKDAINKHIKISSKLLSKVSGEDEEDIFNFLIMQNDNLFKFIVLGDEIDWNEKLKDFIG